MATNIDTSGSCSESSLGIPFSSCAAARIAYGIETDLDTSLGYAQRSRSEAAVAAAAAPRLRQTAAKAAPRLFVDTTTVRRKLPPFSPISLHRVHSALERFNLNGKRIKHQRAATAPKRIRSNT